MSLVLPTRDIRVPAARLDDFPAMPPNIRFGDPLVPSQSKPPRFGLPDESESSTDPDVAGDESS